jgi:hypothetical protein
VGFVKDDEIILKEQASLNFLLEATEQRKEECMIQNQNVRRKDAAARSLEETNGIVPAEVRLVAASFRRA